MEIPELLRLTAQENKRLTITMSDFAVTMDHLTVAAMARQGVVFVSCLRDAAGGVGVGLYDADGQMISLSNAFRLALQIGTTDPNGTLCVLAVGVDGKETVAASQIEDDQLAVSAMAHTTYRISYQYALTCQGENGELFAMTERYLAGAKPEFTVIPLAQHRLSAVVVTNALTGESVTLSSLSEFVMPAYPVTVKAIFTPILYTITFISRGQIVSQKQYKYGETVEVPEVDPYFEEDGYCYTFIGWSSTIDTVTGDAEYTAKYFSVRAEDAPQMGDVGEGSALRAIAWQLGVPAGIAIVVLTVGTILLVRYKKKKKKKEENSVEGE